MKVKKGFDEIFEIEMQGWCYGIQQYPGEIFPGLIHSVIKELAPSFKASIEHYHPFKILDLALKISKAGKYIVHEKEIAFSILAQLPHPVDLDESERFILGQIIDPVEQEYGGAMVRLERKWAAKDKAAA